MALRRAPPGVSFLIDADMETALAQAARPEQGGGLFALGQWRDLLLGTPLKAILA